MFRLQTRLTDAHPGIVVLGDSEIRAHTLVWTAGTSPNPLLKSLPVEKDKRGAVVVDHTLAVPGHAGTWALGDCAAILDAKTGQWCPPTAQFALREAKVLARNIRAQMEGSPLQEISFQFPWRALRHRTPDGLCRVDAAFHTRCVHAFFREIGRAHV